MASRSSVVLLLAALFCISGHAFSLGGGSSSFSRFPQQLTALNAEPDQAVVSSSTISTNDDDKLETKKNFQLYILEGGLCPYAARTWITILELGLPFDLVPVNAMKKEPWFLEINPRGKVPAVQNVEDGSVIYESAICDEYLCDYARQLDETDAATDQDDREFWKLMPVNAADKAAMRLLNDHIDTQLGPAQYTFLMNTDEEKDAEMMETLEDALQVLQDALVERGGPYLMGSHFTLAEAHVLPFFLRLVVSLKHFNDYQIPPQRFGRLLQWYDLCQERESFQTTAQTEERIIEVYQRFVDMKYSFGGLNKNK